MNTRTMRSVLIGFEYPLRTLRIIFTQNPSRAVRTDSSTFSVWPASRRISGCV